MTELGQHKVPKMKRLKGLYPFKIVRRTKYDDYNKSSKPTAKQALKDHRSKSSD